MVRLALTPCLLALSLLCHCGLSQETLATQPVAAEPVGFDVVRRCVEVSGGSESFAAMKSITMKGSITVTPQLTSADGKQSTGEAVTGTLETYFVAPDRARVVVDLGGYGHSVRGINGGVAWETSDAGSRKLKPVERSRMIDSISLRETFQPASVFSSFTNRGRENVGGKPCYRIEVTRRGGTEKDQIFFDVKTGLPARTIAMRGYVGGNRIIDSTISQYETFDGLKIATQIRQEMPTFKMIHDVKIHTVEINSDLDPSLFAPPTDLK